MKSSSNTRFRLLRQVPLFADISDEFLIILSDNTSILRRPKNVIIVQEGDITDSFYIIQAGRVKVYASDTDGNEVVLNYLSTGECFGELSFFDQKPRSASVMTIEPSQILSLPRPVFMQHLKEHPDTLFVLLEVLAGKVRQQTSTTKSLALEDVYARLVKLWFELGELSNDVFAIRNVTHQYLAEHTFASRPMITRIINELEKKGYIRCQRSACLIEIIDTLPAKWH